MFSKFYKIVTAHIKTVTYSKSKSFITYKRLLSDVPSVTSTNFRAKESPTEK